MIDLQLLDKGADYNELNKSYIIFICTFDLFGHGRHIYRFKNCCLECPDLVLEDDATKIFINTKAIQDDVSDEFREMLKVFNGEDGLLEGREEEHKENNQTFVPLLIEMSLKLTGNEENSINEVAASVPNLTIDEIRSVWYEYKKNKDNEA
ncbi:MAG: hypothetical protein II838_15070 [Lachnospiraceae bacterium]|nr:hypothetical protein [Lachnospiraceae bacterium]